MDIQTSSRSITNLEVLFFTNGIFKLKCINPEAPSKFSFELIEKPANLTALPVAGNVRLEDDFLEVDLAEAQLKVIFKFNPIQRYSTFH